MICTMEIPIYAGIEALIPIDEGALVIPEGLPIQEDFYHLGLAVAHLETAMETIGGLFSTAWTPVADDTAPNLYTPDGPSTWAARRTHSRTLPIPVELLEGTSGSTWDTDRLAVPHHVAYWSRDLAGDVTKLVGRGWRLELMLLDEAQRPSEFAYLVKPGAVRVELVAIERRESHLQLVAGPSAELSERRNPA
jgi:hypothetical protein